MSTLSCSACWAPGWAMADLRFGAAIGRRFNFSFPNSRPMMMRKIHGNKKAFAAPLLQGPFGIRPVFLLCRLFIFSPSSRVCSVCCPLHALSARARRAPSLTLIPDASGCFVFAFTRQQIIGHFGGHTTQTAVVKHNYAQFPYRFLSNFLRAARIV